ncbi:chitinase [Ascochyta rabiei]|uniref:Chitinase n=2 Tax=Didymella rabiei TaxID=5454 RepID=A0A163MDT6_DIDRA|nr:chitinase [Ascochyta rabiei]
MEICPLECWLLDWCRPLCRPVDKLPIEPPEKGLKLPWFLTWWWKLPVKDCVPNDCKAECFAWYGLSLAIFKRPICPCVPRTCTKGEDKENKDKKKCKLFGCGCGWMGLPLGPGCVDIQVDFPKIFPFGVFGQNPCKWFGGCKPGPGPKPGPPPEDDNPNDDDFGDEGCGPFGCRGYCYVEGGCEPCPREICGGPKCTKPGGCGPKTGPDPMPEPTRKSKCEEDQKTTVTERIVSCFVDLKVEPTTIMSINYTLTETLTSACLSFEATYTGCGILGTTTTTTVSSFTSTSSEAPACTRAPLDLDNDEGDNAQPTKTTDGPSCTRAPLMLDDDEGDNEQPKSSEAPACTRAPLSLDDDEGNNEMPADMSSSLSVSRSPTPSANSSSIALSSTANSSSIASSTMSMTSSMSPNSSSSSTSRVLPPSTLSMPTTTPPWGSGIPSGTPTPGNCGGCKSYFDVIANGKCRPDGSDAEACAKWSLAELCFGNRSPDYCKTGPCKHSACPKENLGDYSKANPASPFTTVLSLSSTTVSVTATPSKTTVSLSASATPTCKSGGSISPHGKWTAYWEQVNYGDQYSDFTWTLWDENGCEAGKGSANNRQLLGADIVTDIGAQGRPQEQKMGYMLHANTTDSTAESRSEIQFTISKPPAGCTEFCWVKWKITNGIASKPWEITDDCAQQCGMRKLTPTDVGCDDGINKFQTADDDSLNKRGGYCWWRMPFEPANDDPVPPPPPPPPPSPPITRESIWRLEIRQQMEHEKSEVEWTLYDPNKNHAGSGLADTSSGDVVKTIIETQGRDEHPEDKLKYKMQLTVSHPRNKDKSTVKIAYADVGKLPGCKYGTKTGHVPSCNPSYETETDDEANVAILMDCYTKYYGTEWACDRHLVSSTQMSCDPIPHAFRPKNAGFERSFACWWPHDFAPSPGSGGGRALW